ncbi:hypothetical protein [Alkalicoccus urumqiensis]|uniref:Uncharacterized protein n=1 Tax=Alkalicoccus urumqiensis TaxID=1548213 RepID=A0A2P6MJA1_ALKUR|nr:hypothetical protein [Alkalicoccus urumqiensis]PRO66341.1 hypothetical protein C6I21_05935 [Alkalicoccus urumqiensis]
MKNLLFSATVLSGVIGIVTLTSSMFSNGPDVGSGVASALMAVFLGLQTVHHYRKFEVEARRHKENLLTTAIVSAAFVITAAVLYLLGGEVEAIPPVLLVVIGLAGAGAAGYHYVKWTNHRDSGTGEESHD